MEWSSIVSSVVGIPLHILPPIMDTRCVFNCILLKYINHYMLTINYLIIVSLSDQMEW